MKHLLLIVGVMVAILPVTVSADSHVAKIDVRASLEVLPEAGITPESSWYFLDRIGEELERFFTFRAESKARLQLKFAAERMAEIKVILETKGVEAKGLIIAKNRLEQNLVRMNEIIEKQKGKGNNVAFAEELGRGVDEKENALKVAFKVEMEALHNQEKELKAKIKIAAETRDTSAVVALTAELAGLRARREALDNEFDAHEELFDREEDRLEDIFEARIQAEKSIRKARAERAEIEEEAREEGLVLSAKFFANFEGLIVQAEAALSAGKFEEARTFAKDARNEIKQAEDALEQEDKDDEDEEGDNDHDDSEEDNDNSGRRIRGNDGDHEDDEEGDDDRDDDGDRHDSKEDSGREDDEKKLDQSDAEDGAILLLAQELSLKQSEIKVVKTEARMWPDSCLGIYRGDGGCGTLVVPGYRVTLEAEGKIYYYRIGHGVKIRE